MRELVVVRQMDNLEHDNISMAVGLSYLNE